jgi:hypothetical protein
MKIFVFIYILLYISYIILGPHFITRFFRNLDFRYATSIRELLSRFVYLSYITLLLNSYFFYKPNIITWLIAIIFNLLSLFSFIIKWYGVRNIHHDYYPGILSHFTCMIPVIFGYFYYKLNIKKLKLKKIIKPVGVMILFLIVYLSLQYHIYK